MGIGAEGIDLLLNLPPIHPLCDALSRLNHEQAHAGGEVAAINRVNIAQLFGSDAAILIGGGKVGAQVDMHHLVAILHPLTEVFHIFPRRDCARFGQLLMLPPGLIQRIWEISPSAYCRPSNRIWSGYM